MRRRRPAFDDLASLSLDGTTVTVEWIGAHAYFARWSLVDPPLRRCTHCDQRPARRVVYAIYEVGDLTCAGCADRLNTVLDGRVLRVSRLDRTPTVPEVWT